MYFVVSSHFFDRLEHTHKHTHRQTNANTYTYTYTHTHSHTHTHFSQGMWLCCAGLSFFSGFLTDMAAFQTDGTKMAEVHAIAQRILGPFLSTCLVITTVLFATLKLNHALKPESNPLNPPRRSGLQA